MDRSFWKEKKLADFSEEEWEAVCLRCGKCCLYKTVENDRMCFLNQMCDGFDFKTGKCVRYKTRLGDSCVKVDLNLLQTQRELLPETCAYRLLFEGKELPEYHPLVSGDLGSVHKAKKTVLEMPEVYSVNDFMTIMKDIDSLPFDEAMHLLSRYEVVYVEVYDLPQENKGAYFVSQ